MFQPNKLASGDDTAFSKLCKDLKVENVHLKFCKSSLGVNKRATNTAVMAEVGRYPLLLEIIVNMLKYFVRLSNSEDPLLSEALSVSESLFRQNKNSWYGCIQV